MAGEMVVYPVEIRPGLIVRLLLPVDLTKLEADRVSSVILAMAHEPTGPGYGWTLSEETKTQLKAIDDNIRSAKVIGDTLICGHPSQS